MYSTRLLAAFLLLVPLSAAPRHRHAPGVSLRKRLHINDIIAEPGTVEIDVAGLYSFDTDAFTVPTALKATPQGNSFFWGRTEYAVFFDTLTNVTFTATSIAVDRAHFDIAVAPQVARTDAGARAGATVLARYDRSRNQVGAAVTWTGAASATEANPAGIWDLSAGYGRRIARLTPHVEAVIEKATGANTTVSGFTGVEWQITDRLAMDVTVQRYNRDRQLQVGITLNLGRVH